MTDDEMELIHDAMEDARDGELSEERMAEVRALLKRSSEGRDFYLRHNRFSRHVVSALPESGAVSQRSARKLFVNCGLLAACILLALSLFLLMTQREQPPVPQQEIAVIKEITDARWPQSYTPIATGDVLNRNQRLALMSGSVQLEFASGALMTLKGKSEITLDSDNSAAMLLGEAEVYLPMPGATGFTLNTPSSTIVDRGTSFSVLIDPINASERLEVTEGKVEVTSDGWREPRTVKAGQFVIIDTRRKLLSRLEIGDGTRDFRFPTIGPPSGEDYADLKQGHASISIIRGELSQKSEEKMLERLLSHSDKDRRLKPVHFNHLPTELLLDLGSTIPVKKINAYSSYKYRRQRDVRFNATLEIFAYVGESRPTRFDTSIGSEWVRIVNFNKPSRLTYGFDQRVLSVTSVKGEIGRYRYLFFRMKDPTRMVEIDVYKSDG